MTDHLQSQKESQTQTPGAPARIHSGIPCFGRCLFFAHSFLCFMFNRQRPPLPSEQSEHEQTLAVCSWLLKCFVEQCWILESSVKKK